MADTMSPDDRKRLRNELLDWYTTPKSLQRPSSLEKWADDHDVAIATAKKWTTEPSFIRRANRRFAQLNMDPATIQELMVELHSIAQHADNTKDKLQAIGMYMKLVEEQAPADAAAPPPRDYRLLTNEEVYELATGQRSEDEVFSSDEYAERAGIE